MTSSQAFNEKYNLVGISTRAFSRTSISRKRASGEITGKATKNWKEICKRYIQNPWVALATIIFFIVVIISLVVPFLSKFSAEDPISASAPTGEIKLLPYHASVPKIEAVDNILFAKIQNSGINYVDLGFTKTGQHLIEYSRMNFLKAIHSDIKGEPLIGTDALGRDIWTRTWKGTWNSLELALSVAAIETVIGVILGAYIGFHVGSMFDVLMLKIIAIYYAVPTLVWMAILALILPPGPFSLFILFIVIGWTTPVGATRLFVMRERNKDYVKAAQVIGLSKMGIIIKHILPNIAGQLSIGFVHRIPAVIFGEAYLAYLGISNNPDHASLGNVMNEAKAAIGNMQLIWYILLPTIIISSLTISLQIISNGLNDALDPRNGR